MKSSMRFYTRVPFGAWVVGAIVLFPVLGISECSNEREAKKVAELESKEWNRKDNERRKALELSSLPFGSSCQGFRLKAHNASNATRKLDRVALSMKVTGKDTLIPIAKVEIDGSLGPYETVEYCIKVVTYTDKWENTHMEIEPRFGGQDLVPDERTNQTYNILVYGPVLAHQLRYQLD